MVLTISLPRSLQSPHIRSPGHLMPLLPHPAWCTGICIYCGDISATAMCNPPSSLCLNWNRSDHRIHSLDAYYNLIHPSFPILPPPIKLYGVPELVRDDQPTVSDPNDNESFTDYQPSSPLILALLSILVLLPESDDHAVADHVSQELRIKFTQSLDECAMESIEIYSCRMRPKSTTTDVQQAHLKAHPNVPNELEVPLALCILSVREYLQRGNLPRMLELAERAVEVLMQLSMHQSEEEGPFSEAIRRAWWMSVCLLVSSLI